MCYANATSHLNVPVVVCCGNYGVVVERWWYAVVGMVGTAGAAATCPSAPNAPSRRQRTPRTSHQKCVKMGQQKAWCRRHKRRHPSSPRPAAQCAVLPTAHAGSEVPVRAKRSTRCQRVRATRQNGGATAAAAPSHSAGQAARLALHKGRWKG